MVIVLLTDFGLRDPYVGVMKGVIKKINPSAEIIDLTHNISRQNIVEAAITLLVSAKYFPRNSIFVCVVDPGVGSERKALLMKTTNYYLIGPDNGCLSLLAVSDGLESVYDVSRSRYVLKNSSYTFHGRDVFAPIAAYLSLGYPPERLGVRISGESIVYIKLREPEIISKNMVKASVLYIDVFGNVMLNLSREHVENIGVKYGDKVSLKIKDQVHLCRFVKSFSEVSPGEHACYINSWGYFEIAKYMGNAAEELSVDLNDEIYLEVRRR